MYFDNAASSRRTSLFVEEHLKSLGKIRTSQEEIEILRGLSEKIATFLNVDCGTISFVPNASYALNEIALFFFEKGGRDIYISTSEHLSNHLIWLRLFNEYINYFDLESLSNLRISKKSIISLSSMTNLEGRVVDWEIVEDLASQGHEVIVDATQMIQHRIIDLSRSNISYLVFSAHKFYGPNGVGVIYDKLKNNLGLNSSNYLEVSKSYFLDFDALEAWSNSIDEVIGFFRDGVVYRKEEELNNYFLKNFPINDYVEIVNKETKGCIFLFKVISEDISAQDYAFYLARNNVVVRSGLSCSWLSSKKFDQTKIFRVSLNFLNTVEEIDFFFNLIKKFEVLDCL